MKIDRTKIVNRCGYDQVDCLNLATKLSNCSDEELLSSLRQIKVWNYGKCELGLWADVLNRFDDILERAVTRIGKWEMQLDLPGNEKMVSDVVAILDFTAHLIEHSIYRYLYGSWNHVLSLFTSSSLDVLLAVLGLAYNFSKRSNYFARQDYTVRKTFLERLYSVAETWGGDENGFGIASCCSGDYFPPSAGDVLFEYRTQASEGVIISREVSLKNVHQMDKSPSAIMEQVLTDHRMPKSKQMALFSRIRLAHYFSNIEQRHKCVRARLQALSILCYTFEVDERFLYPALIGELVRVLSLPVSLYTDIKACVLRVMTALVNSTRLGIQWGALLETNGISNYHGPLPGLTREWIQLLISNQVTAPSGSCNQQYTTALLSFLYHLACYEENNSHLRYPESFLNNSGVLDAMLQMISWHVADASMQSFVTRAVRVTDQILMSLSMPHQAATKVLMSRLAYEVELVLNSEGRELTNQRSGLMKSILNLLKRICLDTLWNDSMRTLIEEEMPPLMKSIYSNSIFDSNSHLLLFSIETLTNYMYSAPSRLSVMQEGGITEDILSALVKKPLPHNRDFLIQLPVIINTLVLNEQGLKAVEKSGLIDLYVETLIDPGYLSTMKTKRNQRDFLSGRSGPSVPNNFAGSNSSSSVGTGLTAGQMSSAVYELVRSHSSLRETFIKSIIKCLKKVVQDGNALRAHLVPNQSTSERSHFQDYIFNICKFLEKLFMPNNSFISSICSLFNNAGGLEALCDLLTMPGLPYDFPVSAGCASLCNIFGHLANGLPFKAVIEPLFNGLSACLDRLSDLRSSQMGLGSVLLRKYLVSGGDSVCLHQLVIAASYICIIVQIMENLRANSCSNFVNQWLVLNNAQKLGELYSVVAFEGTVLLQLLSLDPSLTLEQMNCIAPEPGEEDKVAPLTKSPLEEGVPTFVEALHVYALIKKTSKKLLASEISQSNAFLAKRPNLVPVVRGTCYVVAYVINSVTELCTAWSHFCARGERASNSPRLMSFSRRRLNGLTSDSIPVEKRQEALSELGRMIHSFLIVTPTKASSPSSSVGLDRLCIIQHYLAIRLVGLLMYDATYKMCNLTTLLSLYTTNCVHHVFKLFDEFIEWASPEPQTDNCFALTSELLEELLLCAEKICNSYEHSVSSSSSSRQNGEVKDGTMEQLSLVFNHEQLHSMLSPIARLTSRPDLLKCLSHRSLEIYLNLLIGLLPKLKEDYEQASPDKAGLELTYKPQEHILADIEKLKKNLFSTCVVIAQLHPSNEMLHEISDVFLQSDSCAQHIETLFRNLCVSLESDKEEEQRLPQSRVKQCCLSWESFASVVELQLVATAFNRMRLLSLRLSEHHKLPKLLLKHILRPLCQQENPLSKNHSAQLTLACLIINEHERSVRALQLRKKVCDKFAGACDWYRYEEELPVGRILTSSGSRSKYRLVNVPETVALDKAFHEGRASVTVPGSYAYNLNTMSCRLNQVIVVNPKRCLLPFPPPHGEQKHSAYEKQILEIVAPEEMAPSMRKNLIKMFCKLLSTCNTRKWGLASEPAEAVLRLLLRLVYTDYEIAKFAATETELVNHLLSLSFMDSFAPKFQVLSNAIIWTMFEDRDCTAHVVRTIVMQYQKEAKAMVQKPRDSDSASPLLSHPLATSDLWRVLLMASPLMLRDPEAVTRVLTQECRLLVSEESIFAGSVQGQVPFIGVKNQPEEASPTMKKLSKIQRKIVDDLLLHVRQLTDVQRSKETIRSPARRPIIAQSSSMDQIVDSGFSGSAMNLSDQTPESNSSSHSVAAAPTTSTSGEPAPVWIKLSRDECIKVLTQLAVWFPSAAEHMARYKFAASGHTFLHFMFENLLSQNETTEQASMLLEALFVVLPCWFQTNLLEAYLNALDRLIGEPSNESPNRRIKSLMVLIIRLVFSAPDTGSFVKKISQQRLTSKLAKLICMVDINDSCAFSTFLNIVSCLDAIVLSEENGRGRLIRDHVTRGASTSSSSGIRPDLIRSVFSSYRRSIRRMQAASHSMIRDAVNGVHPTDLVYMFTNMPREEMGGRGTALLDFGLPVTYSTEDLQQQERDSPLQEGHEPDEQDEDEEEEEEEEEEDEDEEEAADEDEEGYENDETMEEEEDEAVEREPDATAAGGNLFAHSSVSSRDVAAPVSELNEEGDEGSAGQSQASSQDRDEDQNLETPHEEEELDEYPVATVHVFTDSSTGESHRAITHMDINLEHNVDLDDEEEDMDEEEEERDSDDDEEEAEEMEEDNPADHINTTVHFSDDGSDPDVAAADMDQDQIMRQNADVEAEYSSWVQEVADSLLNRNQDVTFEPQILRVSSNPTRNQSVLHLGSLQPRGARGPELFLLNGGTDNVRTSARQGTSGDPFAVPDTLQQQPQLLLLPLHPVLTRLKSNGKKQMQSTASNVDCELLPLTGDSWTSFESDESFWRWLDSLPCSTMAKMMPIPVSRVVEGMNSGIYGLLCDSAKVLCGAELMDLVLDSWHDSFHAMDAARAPQFEDVCAQYQRQLKEHSKEKEEKEKKEENPPSQPPAPPPPQPATETPTAALTVPVSDEETIAAMREDGLDESFLQALPPEMLREVLSDFRRQRQIQALPTNVDAEFINGLPPTIQEEVLSQVAAPAASSSENNAQFLASLPRTLRREILADMEESQINLLPADLQAEALALRTTATSSQQPRLMPRGMESFVGLDRMFGSAPRFTAEHSRALEILLEREPQLNALMAPSTPENRTESRLVNQIFGRLSQTPAEENHSLMPPPKSKKMVNSWEGLDGEGMASILSLVIAGAICKTSTCSLGAPNSPSASNTSNPYQHMHKLLTGNLERLLVGLCRHGLPRKWIMESLLSVLTAVTGGKRSSDEASEVIDRDQLTRNSLFRLGFEAALGCRVHLFGLDSQSRLVIHPRAADVVCGTLLDTLREIVQMPIPASSCLLFNAPSSITAGSSTSPPTLDTEYWSLARNLAVNGPSSQCSGTFAELLESGKKAKWQCSLPTKYFHHITSLFLQPLIRENQSHLEKLLLIVSKLLGYALANATSDDSNKYLLDYVSQETVDFLCILVSHAKHSDKVRTLALHILTDLAKTNHQVRSLVLQVVKKQTVRLSEKILEQIQAVEMILHQLTEDKPSNVSPAYISPPLQDVYNSLYDLVQNEEMHQQNANRATSSSSPSSLSSKKVMASLTPEFLAALRPLHEKNSDQYRFCLLVGLSLTLEMREDAFAKCDEAKAPWDVNITLKAERGPFDHASEMINLWTSFSRLLQAFEESPNKNAVSVLDPLFQAFCLAHLHQAREGFKMQMKNGTGGSSSSAANRRSLLRGGFDPFNSTPNIFYQYSSSASNGPNYRAQNRLNLASLLGMVPALDNYSAVASLTPTAEAMELVHMDMAEAQSPKTSVGGTSPGPSDQFNLFSFAEQHRTSFNRILRGNLDPMNESPYLVYLQHPRVLDFDIKRRFFRQRLQSIAFRNPAPSRYGDHTISVCRERIFEDSYARLHRKSANDWKQKFIIRFINEDGQDAGGLLREWYLLMSREIFNPNYCLFRISPADRVTYSINPASYINSNHLSYFQFVGRFIAKAIYDNKLLECYFTRSFYKHILGVPVKASDLESEDHDFYKGLAFLLKHNVSELDYDLTFSTEINEFGKLETRDLIENGRNVAVTEENKREYVRLVCQERMTGAIRQQLNAFLEGFYEIIPRKLIGIFNEKELELLISGLPNIDIDDLKANTTYNKYQPTSLQVEWFWRALNSFEQEDRARFLQFITGTSKVPLGGFANLEGMHGPTKFQISRASVSTTNHLPCAHTCFNTLELPAYETYEKLRERLLTAIRECPEGYGLA